VIAVRILRYLAAYKLIEQTDVDKWAGSSLTKELSEDGNQNGIKHQSGFHFEVLIDRLTSYRFYTCGVGYAAIPTFLAKTNYRNVEDHKDGPFQEGFKTKESLFEWYQHQQDNLEYFMRWLPKHRGRKTWVDTALVQEIVSKQELDGTVLFVDIGGNVGNICVKLREKVPELRGRVVNQDLPHVVVNTIEHPGVEQSAHDFWIAQPIKGEKLGHSAR
jgi:hypothetical protein